MATRKRITPMQRARQRVSRVNALEMAVSYERKMRSKRTASIRASLDALVERDVPPERWADEVQYSERTLRKCYRVRERSSPSRRKSRSSTR